EPDLPKFGAISALDLASLLEVLATKVGGHLPPIEGVLVHASADEGRSQDLADRRGHPVASEYWPNRGRSSCQSAYLSAAVQCDRSGFPLRLTSASPLVGSFSDSSRDSTSRGASGRRRSSQATYRRRRSSLSQSRPRTTLIPASFGTRATFDCPFLDDIAAGRMRSPALRKTV